MQDHAPSPTIVTSRVLPVISAAIAVGVFILDIITSTEIAVAVLYVGVVLLSARFLQPRGVALASVGCVALTILGYVLSQHDTSPSIALSNRLLSLAAIGVTAVLAAQSRSREMVLREQAGLLDLTHDTVFVRDMNDVVIYWNRGAEELYGWRKEEAVGKVSHQLTQTIFPRPLEEIMAELHRNGRWEGELVHTKRDGTQALVASRWSMRRDARGRPAAILEINNDITERKRAEEELRRSEAYLAEAEALSKSGSWAWNPATKEITYWSQERSRLFGFDPKAGIPSFEALLERIHPEDREKWFANAERAVRIRGDAETDFRIVLPDGEIRHLHGIGHPVFSESGDLLEIIGAAMDVTERKRAEEALQKAQAELAHVTRVTTMGALTASIAHEVNQPLAAIVTNANAALRWLARQPPNLAEVRETLERIVQDGHRASEVIGRVRALFRKTTTITTRVDLNELIWDTVALVQGEVRRHRILLRTELAPDLPPVAGDRVQLQQVLLNLVLNGLEAMEVVEQPRELLIRSRLDESGAVLVAVHDTGIGLDPQHVERVFEAFYTTKAEGMGMGLAICRSIIEAHSGRLWASANEPRGAVFQFTLPSEVLSTWASSH